MLNSLTITQLEDLGLSGMAAALRQQTQLSEVEHLSFDERLGLLLDRESSDRASRRLERRLRHASLRQSAALAEIDYRAKRGLDKRLMLSLASCDWIKRHQNIVITGATGVGKSFVACALAHAACLEGYSALYWRLSRLLDELTLSRGDGRYLKLLKQLSAIDVLLLDDWGLARLNAVQQADLLELIDERHQKRSTIVTSQLPVEHWHDAMADPTLADAIVDRLIHSAHHITLKGDSMRKRGADLHLDTQPRN